MVVSFFLVIGNSNGQPLPITIIVQHKGPIYAVSLADTYVEMPERFKMGGFFAIRRRKKHT